MLSKGSDSGTYSASAPTLSSGDICTLQVDQNGNLKVNVVSGGGGTTVNGISGAVVLTSSDNSVIITPSGQNINLQSVGGGPSVGGLPIGGTVGQVLIKNSSTNYDCGWSNRALDMNNYQIKNLADPTLSQDAATKSSSESTAFIKALIFG